MCAKVKEIIRINKATHLWQRSVCRRFFLLRWQFEVINSFSCYIVGWLPDQTFTTISQVENTATIYRIINGNVATSIIV